MKINLTEGFVRALARNILFENNENIELNEMLQEMNMSPDLPAGQSAAGKLNPIHRAANARADIFKDAPTGENANSRKKRTRFTQYEEETALKDDLIKLPIGDNIVNFEIENSFNSEDKSMKSIKRKKKWFITIKKNF